MLSALPLCSVPRTHRQAAAGQPLWEKPSSVCLGAAFSDSQVPHLPGTSPHAGNQSHGHAGKTCPRPLPRSKVSENQRPYTIEDSEYMIPDLGNSREQGKRGGVLGRCTPLGSCGLKATCCLRGAKAGYILGPETKNTIRHRRGWAQSLLKRSEERRRAKGSPELLPPFRDCDSHRNTRSHSQGGDGPQNGYPPLTWEASRVSSGKSLLLIETPWPAGSITEEEQRLSRDITPQSKALMVLTSCKTPGFQGDPVPPCRCERCAMPKPPSQTSGHSAE